MQKIVILILVMSLFSISPLYSRGLSKTDFIKELNILFLKENYTGLVNSVGNNFPRYRLSRKQKREVIYLTALSYLKLRNFIKARKLFNKILSMGDSNLKQDAYIGIANSYFLEKNYSKAIKAYKTVLSAYPVSDKLSGVYYNLGLIYKAKKDSDKANYYFQKVKERYGNSFEADKTVYLSKNSNVDYYIVQMGAFTSLRNAKKLVRKLSRKKFDSYIQKVKKRRKNLYRVRGGKFSNKAYAKRLKNKLRRSGFSAKIIEE